MITCGDMYEHTHLGPDGESRSGGGGGGGENNVPNKRNIQSITNIINQLRILINRKFTEQNNYRNYSFYVLIYTLFYLEAAA
jgi:hypothetical protein